MKQGNLKGIVFDLDGTIIHSSINFPLMKRRMIAILEDEGVPRGILTPQQTTVIILEKTKKIWEEQSKPEADKDKVLIAIEEVMNRTELEAIPNIREVKGSTEALHLLRRRGYSLAILTRGHHEYAVEALKKIGAFLHFDLILGRGETPRPKPYAEALEHTAKLLGMSLDEILFVGDHPIDSSCAVNAGVRFVAVLSERMKEKDWIEYGQKTILGSVKDIPGYLDIT